MNKNMPLGVEFLAAVFVIAGLLNILSGAFPTSVIAPINSYKWFATSTLAGMFIVIVGLFQEITALAVVEKEGYAKHLSIIFALIGLLSFPIGTIFSLIAIVLLFTPEVKGYLS